jgi:hypothetical protein
MTVLERQAQYAFHGKVVWKPLLEGFFRHPAAKIVDDRASLMLNRVWVNNHGASFRPCSYLFDIIQYFFGPKMGNL